MTSAQRVAKRRAALREQGLKMRTFWLPDVNSATFKAAVARDEATMRANAGRRDDDIAFAESIRHVPE